MLIKVKNLRERLNSEPPHISALTDEQVSTLLTNADPSPDKRFVNWLAMAYQKFDPRRFQDVLDYGPAILEKFMARKTKESIESYNGLFKLKDSLANKSSIHDELFENIGKNEADEVFSDHNIKVYLVYSVHGVRYYGKNTSWLFTSAKGFSNYSWRGDIFIVHHNDGRKFHLFNGHYDCYCITADNKDVTVKDLEGWEDSFKIIVGKLIKPWSYSMAERSRYTNETGDDRERMTSLVSIVKSTLITKEVKDLTLYEYLELLPEKDNYTNLLYSTMKEFVDQGRFKWFFRDLKDGKPLYLGNVRNHKISILTALFYANPKEILERRNEIRPFLEPLAKDNIIRNVAAINVGYRNNYAICDVIGDVIPLPRTKVKVKDDNFELLYQESQIGNDEIYKAIQSKVLTIERVATSSIYLVSFLRYLFMAGLFHMLFLFSPYVYNGNEKFGIIDYIIDNYGLSVEEVKTSNTQIKPGLYNHVVQKYGSLD